MGDFISCAMLTPVLPLLLTAIVVHTIYTHLPLLFVAKNLPMSIMMMVLPSNTSHVMHMSLCKNIAFVLAVLKNDLDTCNQWVFTV